MKQSNNSQVGGSKLASSVMLGLALLSLSPMVSARTDVPAKLEQLKENVSASQSNLEQYEQGLRVVNSNLQATEKALKTILVQKQAIAKQTGQAANDKQAIGAAKLEVEGQLRTERDKLATEERQIEELRQALSRLEANREKRLANIAVYEQRLQAVASDQAGSNERTQSVNELEAALRSQEEQALAEKKRLTAKKAEYEQEIEKWKKQVRVSQRSVANFSRLKSQ